MTPEEYWQHHYLARISKMHRTKTGLFTLTAQYLFFSVEIKFFLCWLSSRILITYLAMLLRIISLSDLMHVKLFCMYIIFCDLNYTYENKAELPP